MQAFGRSLQARLELFLIEAVEKSDVSILNLQSLLITRLRLYLSHFVFMYVFHICGTFYRGKKIPMVIFKVCSRVLFILFFF